MADATADITEQGATLTQADAGATGHAQAAPGASALSLSQAAPSVTGGGVASLSARVFSLTQPGVAGGASNSATLTAKALTLTQLSPVARGGASAGLSAIGLAVSIRGPAVLTLGIPVAYTPAAAAIARSGAPLLSWSPITGAATYDVEVSTDPTFVAGVTRFTVTESEAQHGYEFGKTFYWRVRANGLGAVSQFSTARAFTVPAFNPAPDLAHDAEGRGRVLEQFKEYA